jgi:hypothetical protein
MCLYTFEFYKKRIAKRAHGLHKLSSKRSDIPDELDGLDRADRSQVAKAF